MVKIRYKFLNTVTSRKDVIVVYQTELTIPKNMTSPDPIEDYSLGTMVIEDTFIIQ